MLNLQDFKFIWNYPNSIGILNRDDLNFFYYDVAAQSLTGSFIIFDWNEMIEEYIQTHGMIIDECEDCILQFKEFESNKMFFIARKNETKPEAFFRHIRNAFAHFNINHCDDYYYMKDTEPGTNKVTMIGQLKTEDLQQLCHLFLGQHDSIIKQL